MYMQSLFIYMAIYINSIIYLAFIVWRLDQDLTNKNDNNCSDSNTKVYYELTFGLWEFLRNCFMSTIYSQPSILIITIILHTALLNSCCGKSTGIAP